MESGQGPKCVQNIVNPCTPAHNATSGIRTCTELHLKQLPLPVGLRWRVNCERRLNSQSGRVSSVAVIDPDDKLHYPARSTIGRIRTCKPLLLTQLPLPVGLRWQAKKKDER